ncbi:MAG: endolytic transglycosylase MltG [Bacteroidales bacterium]
MKKKLFMMAIFLLLLAIAVGGYAYYVICTPNTQKVSSVLWIPQEASFQQVVDSLKAHDMIKNEKNFRLVAKLMKYERVKPGKYKLEGNSSNYELVRMLRKGQHHPVKFTFNNVRTKNQLIEKIGNRFFFEPKELESLINDPRFLESYGLTTENVMTVFIPDSYEIFYDVTARDFFEKMYASYQRFWTDNRKSLAQKMGLTPIEVAILASIVEEENYRESEKAIIAGLYLNRLNIGMKLQADPTVKFAVGDFSLKRILLKHTEIDSPYNTYLYQGLPPGPIRIPERSTLDSVLHYTHHDYLYMCAKEDLSGAHNFAKSPSQHAANAAKYHRAINKLKIRK